MITAVFTDGDDCVWAYGLWQWDYGQQLRIEGLHLPTVVEIHFSLQEAGGEAVPRVGVTKDGVTTVTIPDSMLEGTGAVRDYQVYAWVYLSDRTFGETTKQIMMKVKARSKPKAFDAPGDGEIFHQAIEAVNDAAKRAEEAGDKAVSAADEAKAAATQTAKHLQVTEGLAEQVETNADTVAQDKQAVAGMLSQTQQAASDAALSAQAAKLSETAAAQAQTGAEAAEDGARQYAEDTGADRQAVANDKQVVSQMREAVAADRKAVEQTALQFGQAAQSAINAVGQAQEAAVQAVSAEGQKQTTAVQEAGTQAVSEVTEAKTEAVQSVTAEGDKQTKRVEDAAANLADGAMDLAPAIHNTASGFVISADDATEGRPFRGLRVLGRTDQAKTTGKNLLDIERYFALGYDKYYNTVANLKNGIITVTNQNDSNGSVSFKDLGELNIYPPFTLSAKVNKTNCYVKVIGINNEGQHTAIYNITDTIKSVFVDRKDNVAKYIVQLLTTVENSDFEVSDIQIESGETATSYEPYTGGKPSPSPEYPQEIVNVGESGSINVEVAGKNLFDINGDLNIRSDGTEANGVNVVEGNMLISNVNTASTYSTGQRISITPGRKYTVSAKIVSIGTGIKSRIDIKGTKSAKLIYSKSVGVGYSSGTFVSEDNEIIIGFGCDGGVGAKYTDIQLEESDAPTPYEPYRTPQPITLATPNGLPGVPVSKDGNYTDADGQQWICDEIDLEREKYVQRMAEKDVLEAIPLLWSGAGKWGNNDGYKTLAFYAYINGANSNENWDAVKNYGICNYAIITSNVFNNSIIGFTLGDYIAFRVPRELLPDWDENNPRNEPWTNWLRKQKEAGNPVIVRYALKTPIERDLTPEEIAAYKALRTYGPTTVVSNDAGAGMEVTYVADTKAYIQNLEERLNAKLVNIQSALISQKTSGGGCI